TKSSAEIELIRHKTLQDKKEFLKKVVEEEKLIRAEINSLEERRKLIEDKVSNLSNLEEKYDSKILEIEEISGRNEVDIDTTLLYKEREIENSRNIIKRSKKDLEDI